ncbi:helix-hairpin-helix domain-containing protein [Halopenitus sp. H-Gu1]|uniref:helix-hairpin-helix domain-containing protein n=1 Tax=Halopenitus sp. H-Gu1 TaxID=3242697 RepID=UPI00359D6C46
MNDARLLTKDFATYLESIDDRRLMLQERDRDDLKLTMPYHTRFNNERRKREQWARYNTAWELADERYQRGVMITLTTDPKRYGSIGAMLDGLMDAWQDLHETLNQRYLDDQRLDFIRALEFGGSAKSDHIGLPHLHVCVFGVPYVDHGWLKNYWTDRHGEIVHIHGMNKRGADSWVMNSGQHRGKSAAGYLGKYLSKTFESIGDDPDELFARIESWEEGGDWPSSELWKLALYWATGRQFWDCSHDLKDNTNVDRLEDVPGLGETKLARLNDQGIRTISDVRLTDTDEIAAIDGISPGFAEKLKEIVGEPSEFDVFSFEFVGAARWSEMPAAWSASARHYGVRSAIS